MAIYNLPNYKTADGFGMSLNIRRGNPNPLDNSSVWASYEEALNYAQTSAIAYVGQLVTVVDFTEAVLDGETVATPAQAKVDVYKIELGENGVGTLVKVGAEEAQAAIDELELVIDGIQTDLSTAQTNITGLDTRLGTAETDLGVAKEDIAKAKEDIATNASAIETINGEITSIKGDATTLNGTVSGHETRISTLETEKANYASKTEVATAKQEAIDAAVKAVLFDGEDDDAIANAYDTIKEIAEWIASDTTASTELVGRIKAIEDDYLKGEDKTTLQTSINELTTFVGSLPEGAVSKNIVAYIKEAIDALAIGDYAKVTALTAVADRVTALETSVGTLSTDLNGLGTRVGTLETDLGTLEGKVDDLQGAVEDEFDAVDELITGIDGRVTTLETKEVTTSDVVGLADLLRGKVDVVTSSYKEQSVAHRLLTPEEADKLSKLVLNEDGSVTTGQTVAAGDVQGLADWLSTNGSTYVKNIDENNLSDELITKLDAKIKEIKIGDTALTVTNGSVTLPFATNDKYGVVKLGAEFKTSTDGVLEISTLNANKLVQTEGEFLQLNGGTATGFNVNS